jgi:hypothetical protein
MFLGLPSRRYESEDSDPDPYQNVIRPEKVLVCSELKDGASECEVSS